MSSKPQPEELASAIQDRLGKLFDANAEPQSFPAFELAQIARDIARLESVNRVVADALACDLETIRYDYERCKKLIENIEANGHADDARATSLRVHSNFLYASVASRLVRQVFERPGHASYVQVMEAASAVGAFAEIANAIALASEKNLIMVPSKLIVTSGQVAVALKALDISDAQVAACIDVAGEFIRERKLLWLERRPDIYVVPVESGRPAIAIEYRLPVSSDDASEMSWELASEIITRDLAVDGLSIGFAGVA